MLFTGNVTISEAGEKQSLWEGRDDPDMIVSTTIVEWLVLQNSSAGEVWIGGEFVSASESQGYKLTKGQEIVLRDEDLSAWYVDAGTDGYSINYLAKLKVPSSADTAGTFDPL